MAQAPSSYEVVEILESESDEEIKCVHILKKKKIVIGSSNTSVSIFEDNNEDEISIVGSSSMITSKSAAKVNHRADVIDVLENRAEQIKKLVEEYGDYEVGWGLKVTTIEVGEKQVPSEVLLSVLPSPNSHNTPTDQFNLVIAQPETSQVLGPYRNFPPIRIRMEYLSVYNNQARFLLTCSWLLKDHLKRLTEEVQRKYVKHGYSLLHAVQFIERKSIKFLGIIRHRKITYATLDFPHRKSSFIVFHDPNIISDMFQELHKKLVNFDGTTLPDSKTFECGICFDRKPVMSVLLFSSCKHFFCRACVGVEFGLKIREGKVKEIRCLSHDCQTVVETDVIKSTVDSETFRRFCDLTTESFVDQSSMFIRCPRKECSAPMEILPNGPREIVCLACQYNFCGTCKAAAHPNNPCLTDEQKVEIRRTWKDLDAEGRKEMEKRYGAANIQFAFQDAESEEWISKNSKPCPKCKTRIQKVSGCNKMVCTGTGCGVFFCWLCLQVLPKQNPYGHFSEVTGACAGRLHQNNVAPHNPAANFGIRPAVHVQRRIQHAAVDQAHRFPLPPFPQHLVYPNFYYAPGAIVGPPQPPEMIHHLHHGPFGPVNIRGIHGGVHVIHNGVHLIHNGNMIDDFQPREGAVQGWVDGRNAVHYQGNNLHLRINGPGQLNMF